MLSPDFITTTHAKWILAGEHAVIRHHPALVFPVPKKTLTLSYWQSAPDIRTEFFGDCGEDIHLLFWSVLEYGLSQVNRSLSDIQGKFTIENGIRIGAGLGASAALCAALSRWFIWKGFVAESALYTFARELENLFHGKSSGVDIAGALADTGILFQQHSVVPLTQSWQPRWYLSFTEQIGITAHCVKKVNELWQQSPQQAALLDQQMADAVKMAVAALSKTEAMGLLELATAIQQAQDCFKQWGLLNNNLEQHINSLMEAGALACKPTGSGDGGYVLSLWGELPPLSLRKQFISL